MDMFRLYVKYVSMFFKSSGEYTLSFYAAIFSNIYSYSITFSIFWVLTQRFDSIGGWNFSEISILYGLNLLTYAISGTLFWYTVYFLENMVTTGGLDRFLLRPVGLIPQLMCQGFGYTFLGQIFISLIFLISAVSRVHTEFTFVKILYILLSLVGGTLLQAGAIILVGSLSFWILRSTEIGQIVYYDIRGFVNYPLVIYPKFIKVTLTFIFPWAFINYYPSLIIMDKDNNLLDSVLGYLSPLVGIVFFIFALYVFKAGLRKYESSGN